MPARAEPRLTIVIPSHNRPDLLTHCLASVTAHAPADCEIVVVDDGSRQACVSRAAAAFPGVLTVRRPRAGGFAAAANLGFATATAPIVELLNDDAIVTRGWAEPALAHFADSTIAAVAPLVLQGVPGVVAPRIDSAGDDYDPGGFARAHGRGERLSPAHLQARSVHGASGSAGFYRASAVRSVGGFAESFGSYFEDVDLACRLQSAGWRAWFEPSSVVWHRGQSSHGRGNWRLLARQSCNEERLFWRNSSWGWLPRHVAVVLAKAALRLAERRFVPFLLGRVTAWTWIVADVCQRRT
jgi:GT2 family glycosyltransferase